MTLRAEISEIGEMMALGGLTAVEEATLARRLAALKCLLGEPPTFARAVMSADDGCDGAVTAKMNLAFSPTADSRNACVAGATVQPAGAEALVGVPGK